MRTELLPGFSLRNQYSLFTDDPAVPAPYSVAPAHRLMDPALRKGARELAKRGLTFDTWLFQPQLSEQFTVLIPDIPGAGSSRLDGEAVSMEQLASIVPAILELNTT